MDCITTPAGGDGPPRTPMVELDGIVPSGQFLQVTISAGSFSWHFQCTPSDVQSFAKFQAAAVKQCKVWVQHGSQEEARALRRVDEWNSAVTAAFQRGGAEIK